MEEMVEKEYITLDDGEKYIILKTLDGTNKYIYLANVKNVEDFLIQKIIVENGVEYIVNLDSESEFDEAALLYQKN